MKLVDILARDLKVWPSSNNLIQWSNGCIYRSCLGDAHYACLELAEDFEIAEVTRAQWQAAVDVLNDIPKFPSDDVEWTGEGLPPVGTKCEAKTTRGWSSGTIIAHGLPPKENLAVWQEDGELIFWGVKEYFRPIRTPEQIEQQEIQKIRDAIGWKRPQLGVCPVEQMYLLGYRKFEIVDN